MKKKKKSIFLIIILLLFTTGCDVTYNLKFYDENFDESISFDINNSYQNIETINFLKNSKQHAYYVDAEVGNLDYKLTYDENDDKVSFNYQFNYGLNFDYSRPLRECFDAYSFIEEDEYYIIQTGKKFNCLVYDYMVIDSVQIVFETDKEVLENNADKILGDKYIWNINSENSNDKELSLKIAKNEKAGFIDNIINEIQNSSLFLVFSLVMFVIIILIVLLVVYKINKKNNAI